MWINNTRTISMMNAGLDRGSWQRRADQLHSSPDANDTRHAVHLLRQAGRRCRCAAAQAAPRGLKLVDLAFYSLYKHVCNMSCITLAWLVWSATCICNVPAVLKCCLQLPVIYTICLMLSSVRLVVLRLKQECTGRIGHLITAFHTVRCLWLA